jgi:hypothetical protein
MTRCCTSGAEIAALLASAAGGHTREDLADTHVRSTVRELMDPSASMMEESLSKMVDEARLDKLHGLMLELTGGDAEAQKLDTPAHDAGGLGARACGDGWDESVCFMPTRSGVQALGGSDVRQYAATLETESALLRRILVAFSERDVFLHRLISSDGDVVGFDVSSRYNSLTFTRTSSHVETTSNNSER